ncbi:hypothetical protein AVEN_255332-1 [Araneus ventricosus]|uniref:Uncharacterized protein n=1 Tax=Araneus ventricosus TaxID=182803 RepID=A0A4Y2GX09_ARAVE|nr:hypothetical protein AVEN_255332-1 [Araneus ventricosus]
MFISIPPILDTDGIKYTPLGKANAFKHSLENSSQENPKPYFNLHINEVNNSVSSYFNNLTKSSTLDLISSQELINLIKKINTHKATGPDDVTNKAIRMLTLNAVTHLQFSNFPSKFSMPYLRTLPGCLENCSCAYVP